MGRDLAEVLHILLQNSKQYSYPYHETIPITPWPSHTPQLKFKCFPWNLLPIFIPYLIFFYSSPSLMIPILLHSMVTKFPSYSLWKDTGPWVQLITISFPTHCFLNGIVVVSIGTTPRWHLSHFIWLQELNLGSHFCFTFFSCLSITSAQHIPLHWMYTVCSMYLALFGSVSCGPGFSSLSVVPSLLLKFLNLCQVVNSCGAT